MPETVVDALSAYILSPLIDTLLGLFDFNGRLGLPFLCISLVIAFFLYRRQRQLGYSQTNSFRTFLGGRKIWLHRSARVDYVYYFVRPLLHLAFIAPIISWLDPMLLKQGDVTAFLQQVWAARPQLGNNMGIMLLFGLGAFLVSDFAHYWLHRAFHSRWLWEFHKVHHSATVMVPPTASRIHFFEKLCENLLKGSCFALYAGVIFWFCGNKVNNYTLFGIGYLSFIFNVLAANLVTSH